MSSQGLSDRKYVDTHGAERHTGVSYSKLTKQRVHGTGCHYIKIGRRVLYDTADLDAWLAANKRRSTSESGGEG